MHQTETGPFIQRVTALTLEDEEEVVALLKEIIKNERQLEAIKVDLARNSDFNLQDAFLLIDKERKGWVTP